MGGLAERFRAECQLAGKLYGQRFSVDVAFGEPILGEPEVVTAEDVLGFVGIAPPMLRLYPVETHVAFGTTWTPWDNPTLRGFFVPRSDMRWSYPNWNSDQMIDPKHTQSTLQSFQGASAIQVRADLPVFSPGMYQASFAAGRAAETWLPRTSKVATPSVWFPEECSFVQGCERLAGNKTVPWTASSVRMNEVFAVEFTLEHVVTQTLWGAPIGLDQQTIARRTFGLTNVEVVPIHVHVFVDGNYHNGHNFQLATTIRQQSDVPRRVEWIQRVFDRTMNTWLGPTGVPGALAQVAKLNAPGEGPADRDGDGDAVDNPLLVPHAALDEAFGFCNVQLQIASVSIIPQSDGLEENVGAGIRHRCDACSTIKDGNIHVVSSYVRAALEDPRLGVGVHVFSVGRFPENDFRNGLGCGLNCSIGPEQSFAFVRGDFWVTSILAHEIGHVLGLGEIDAETFEGSVSSMTGAPPRTDEIFEGGPSICDMLHDGAARW